MAPKKWNARRTTRHRRAAKFLGVPVKPSLRNYAAPVPDKPAGDSRGTNQPENRREPCPVDDNQRDK